MNPKRQQKHDEIRAAVNRLATNHPGLSVAVAYDLLVTFDHDDTAAGAAVRNAEDAGMSVGEYLARITPDAEVMR